MRTETVIIGDIHLHDRCMGYLDAQVKFLINLINSENPGEVVFLGDIFEFRRPDPKSLLAFKEIVDFCSKRSIPMHVVTGNHDQNSKADDGVTALSLFKGKDCSPYIHNTVTEYKSRVYIPFFEEEAKIVEALKNAYRFDKGCAVFGHFGFHGALNSGGNADFSISLDKFKNVTFLGHIHENREIGDNVYVVGTPYDTTPHYIGDIPRYYYVLTKSTHNGKTIPTHSNPLRSGIIRKQTKGGPRLFNLKLAEIPYHLDDIHNPENFSLVKIHLPQLEYDNREDIITKYNLKEVGYFEFVFDPLLEKDEDFNFLSSSEQEMVEIDRALLHEYVKNQNTSLDEESIMDGLEELEDED